MLILQDRSTFRRIVLKNAYMKRKMYEQLLESVPLLKHLEVSNSYCWKHEGTKCTASRDVTDK